MILGAPFDGGTSHRPGARFGPQAIRGTDYLPHDASRPHLALGVDPLAELRVVDAGDVEMPPGDTELSLRRLEEAVHAVCRAGAMPVILGGDHTITLPDATGVARHVGWGRVSVIHFDAHADTGNTQWGSLYGHGTPMRRLIESGAVRGDRFLQLGLRGYWPEPETLDWMAGQRMRSFEMTEVVARGLDACLDRGVRDRHRRLRRRVPVRRRGRGRPRHGAGHRHARAGRADRPAAARRGPPDRDGDAAGRDRRGRGLAALRPRRGDRVPGATGWCSRRCPASPGAPAAGRAGAARCAAAPGAPLCSSGRANPAYGDRHPERDDRPGGYGSSTIYA